MSKFDSVVEVLWNAAKLLEENDWCTGSDARNSEGLKVGFDSHDACSWCLRGAIFRGSTQFVGDFIDVPDSAGHVWKSSVRKVAFDAIYKTLGVTSPNSPNIVAWNDGMAKTKAEVVEVLKKAAQMLQEDENNVSL